MEKRPYSSRDESSSGGGYSRSDSASASGGGYSRNDSSSGGYTRNDSSSGGGYSRNDSSGGGYSRTDTGSSSGGYSRNDSSSGGGYSKSYDTGSSSGGGYSRNDSSSGGGYSRSDSSTGGGYSRSDSSTGGYSRSDSSTGGYSRSDSSGYKSRGGGYSSRGGGGRGGGRGGYGSQSSGDSWECPSCRFSNYANRTSCYKCRASKDGGSGGDEPRAKWGRSDDSSWKKPSWNSGSSSGNSYGSRDRSNSSYGKSNDWKSDSKWGNEDRNRTAADCLVDWDDIAKNGKKYEAEKWAALPDIIKNLYVEHPEVTAMSSEQVKTFRHTNNEMEVKSYNPEKVPIPNPVANFGQAFSGYPMIMKEIQRQGFTAPSPIQCQAWPILMKGHDMIGTSQTGTGKTLAFLLPALLHIVAQPTPRWERIGPTTLVLAPTRELAQQIEREVIKFEYENIRCVCCYGQGDKRNQVQKLNAMSEIVIATPGRLNDFLEQGIVNLNGVSYLVLDEADRMLDMGFEPQVRKIVMHVRPDRQTILTSATWPQEVRALAGKLMKDPIHVIVGSLDLKAVDTITQHVVVCSIMEKEDKLMEYLKNMTPDDKAIVFVAQKITVDHLSTKLYEAGFYVESMHGGRNQRDREHSLRQLKTGRSKILIATDVAARGIDITDITHVFNYDCPKDMEEYVHRVGRTGRAGKLGTSCTLMCRDDWKVAGKLIEILEKSNQKIPPELEHMKRRWDRVRSEKSDRYNRNGHYGGGGGGRNEWYSP